MHRRNFRKNTSKNWPTPFDVPPPTRDMPPTFGRDRAYATSLNIASESSIIPVTCHGFFADRDRFRNSPNGAPWNKIWLRLEYLPTYSPEWNPSEKPWGYLRGKARNGSQSRNARELRQETEEMLNRLKEEKKKDYIRPFLRIQAGLDGSGTGHALFLRPKRAKMGQHISGFTSQTKGRPPVIIFCIQIGALFLQPYQGIMTSIRAR